MNTKIFTLIFILGMISIETRSQESDSTNNTITISEIEVISKKNYGLTPTNFLDLKLLPANTAQDLLRLVPGLFIAQHAGGGKAEQIFLRGFDIDHGTDLYIGVDGMPVNMVSHAHGQGYADLHFVIPETIGEFSVLKGPYAAKYGDFTTSGAVEFKTANVVDNHFKTEYGEYNTFRGLGIINLLSKNNKNHSAYIASEYALTNGYFESKQKFNRFNLFAKYSVNITKNSFLSFSGSTFSAHWNASGQVPERAVDNGAITRFGSIDDSEGGNTTRTNLNVILANRIAKNVDIKNQLYYVNYNFNLFSNFTFFLRDSINGDQIGQNDKRNIFGYSGTLSINSKHGKVNLKSVFGAGARFDYADIYLAAAKERVMLNYLSNGSVKQKNVSIYVDELAELYEKITINAGIRLDYFNFNYNDLMTQNIGTENKFTISPKLSLYYNAASDVQLFAKTGLGFHSNDARVVVAQTHENTLPKAFGYEAGSVFKLGKNIIANVSLWGLNLESEFVYVGDEAIVEPSGKTRRLGVDFSVRSQLTRWLWADADFNYTYGRFIDEPEGNNRIPLAPVFTSIGGLSFKLNNGLSGSLRYRYMATRPANENNSVNAGGYFITDAVLNYSFSNYTVGVSVENLLNNRSWNEAQFDTESRLAGEVLPVSELHFTPGKPIFVKAMLGVNF